jgi:hypothetical protein
MMTANYAALKKIVPPLQPVSISRGKPRYLKGGWKCHCQPGCTARDYDALAPSWAALKGTDDEYNASFAAQLAALDPRAVFADLGANAVLLCHCKPNVFCPRPNNQTVANCDG